MAISRDAEIDQMLNQLFISQRRGEHPAVVQVVGFPVQEDCDRVYVRRATLSYRESSRLCRIDQQPSSEKSEPVCVVDSDDAVIFNVYHSPIVDANVLYGKLDNQPCGVEYRPIPFEPGEWFSF